jgi:NAD(P)-dependent dehydrogenase (short-subunit alcohol dehydrogenase family)
MKKLENKIAVITGGSSGIGLATAKLMVSEGALVAIVGRDTQKLEVAAKEIGDGVLSISADASSIAGIGQIIERVQAAFGRIDILFANAGMSDCPPILGTDEAFFDEIMDINVKGVFFLFTKAFPLLAANASVIFTSSVAHSKGRPGDPLYAATKAAVRSLSRTLAMDEATLAKKIRVNVVSPGVIQTPLTRQDTPEMERAIDGYVKAMVPMQRWGQADEVAKAVLFLASSDAAYMTGGEITIDGGLGQL